MQPHLRDTLAVTPLARQVVREGRIKIALVVDMSSFPLHLPLLALTTTDRPPPWGRKKPHSEGQGAWFGTKAHTPLPCHDLYHIAEQCHCLRAPVVAEVWREHG